MSKEIVRVEQLEYQTIIKYLYLKGLRGNQINKDMFNILGNQCCLYASIKNWIASWTVSVSTTVNNDAVHEMISSVRRIRPERISETLNILYERVYHKVHLDLVINPQVGYISTRQKQSSNRCNGEHWFSKFCVQKSAETDFASVFLGLPRSNHDRFSG